jgi:tRNA(fMet)-specific endonuclease VapC
MTDYVFDSGILIHHLRNQTGYQELTTRLALEGLIYISAMTRLETIRGMRDRERKATFNLLDSLQTIAMTAEIADSAGELIRSWKTRGILAGDADAIIAATAIQNGLALVTTNARHFPMPELIVFQADEKGNLTPAER